MSFEAMSRHRALPRPPFDGSQKRLTLEVGIAHDGGVRNGDGSPGDGGQPAAWSLPRRAGGIVSAAVAMGVCDLRHFPRPCSRHAIALVTLSPGGCVAALRLDVGVFRLRSCLPLPHRGPRQRLHPGAGRVADAVPALGRIAGCHERARSAGRWMGGAHALAPAGKDTIWKPRGRREGTEMNEIMNPGVWRASVARTR